MNNRPTHAILITILVVLAVGVALVAVPKVIDRAVPEEGVATTTPTDTADWQTKTEEALSFSYPAELPTIYMRASEWPPKVSVATNTAPCALSNDEIGSTQSRVINGRTYCVTFESEGAAGSTYTNYTYATEKDGKFVTLSFTIRTSQCANYDAPQMTACQEERDSYKIDDLVEKIVSSIQFK
jgi:hypothetical protein